MSNEVKPSWTKSNRRNQAHEANKRRRNTNFNIKEGRTELIEECALSLVRRLMQDRRQNQRELKILLQLAWKIGSDMRIVHVANDTYQFKFPSEYQMKWVETNGS